MPYHIIKKVRLLGKGTSTYLPTFGVDLEDNKTWGLFKLYRSPSPIIQGEVIRLLDFDGVTKDIIEKSYDFETHCECYYAGYAGQTQVESNRLLYLPPKLIQGYGIDENTAIDLILHKIVYCPQTTEEEKFEIYEKLVDGPRDVEPKMTDDKLVEKNLIAYCTECGTSLGQFKSERDLRILVADQKNVYNVELLLVF